MEADSTHTAAAAADTAASAAAAVATATAADAAISDAADAEAAAAAASEAAAGEAAVAVVTAEDSLCIVCFTVPRAVRLLPCGHCTTCEACTVHIIGSSKRRCPNCRASFGRVDWRPLEPLVPVRMPTFEVPEGEGLSLREFLLTAAIEPHVLHAP